MRNSFLPVIGVMMVAIIAMLAIPRDHEMGQDGPQITAGILRLPKDQRKMVQAAPLQAGNVATVVNSPARVLGLEPDAWRVVTIVAGDNRILTRTVVLGLAEQLTLLGSVAIISEATKPPMPLAPDRVLTITTSDERLPDVAGGPCSGTVHIHQEPVALPDAHPASGLQGSTGVARIDLRIDHTSSGPGGSRPRWAEWFAAVGRSIGDQIIASLAGPTGLPQEWDRARPGAMLSDAGTWTFGNPQALYFILVIPVYLLLRLTMLKRLPVDHRQRAGRWRLLRPIGMSVVLLVLAVASSQPHRRPDIVSSSDPLITWTKHLPIAPSMDVLRWRGCFADDLVRGWVGRIGGTTALDRGGKSIPAETQVLAWLGKYAVDDQHEDVSRWQEDPSPSTGQRIWRHEKDGNEECFLLAKDDHGFDCVLWQEQTRGASVQARWLEAAEDPTYARAARRLLRRHLLCPRIPDDQRAEAAVVLRRNPDAAEVAMLAELPDASEGEKDFARAARYAYGREVEAPTVEDPKWTRLTRGSAVTLDGRPTLLQAGDTYVLVLYRPDGGGEVVVRSSASWVRVPIGMDGTATVSLGDSVLVLAADNVVSWR